MRVEVFHLFKRQEISIWVNLKYLNALEVTFTVLF